VRFGGHSAAAGFTIETDKIDQLDARLQDLAATGLSDDMLTPTLKIDAEVDLNRLSEALFNELNRLEPFGQANPPTGTDEFKCPGR
jgi:single-stranded-DNA-specific exonuclease